MVMMFCILTEQCQYHVCDTGCTTVLQDVTTGENWVKRVTGSPSYFLQLVCISCFKIKFNFKVYLSTTKYLCK